MDLNEDPTVLFLEFQPWILGGSDGGAQPWKNSLVRRIFFLLFITSLLRGINLRSIKVSNDEIKILCTCFILELWY